MIIKFRASKVMNAKDLIGMELRYSLKVVMQRKHSYVKDQKIFALKKIPKFMDLIYPIVPLQQITSKVAKRNVTKIKAASIGCGIKSLLNVI